MLRIFKVLITILLIAWFGQSFASCNAPGKYCAYQLTFDNQTNADLYLVHAYNVPGVHNPSGSMPVGSSIVLKTNTPITETFNWHDDEYSTRGFQLYYRTLQSKDPIYLGHFSLAFSDLGGSGTLRPDNLKFDYYNYLMPNTLGTGDGIPAYSTQYTPKTFNGCFIQLSKGKDTTKKSGTLVIQSLDSSGNPCELAEPSPLNQ